MRDRRARLAFLALILAIPLILGASAQAGPPWAGGAYSAAFRTGRAPFGALPAAIPITLQVELLIVAGLMYANVQRRRLLACGVGPADRA